MSGGLRRDFKGNHLRMSSVQAPAMNSGGRGGVRLLIAAGIALFSVASYFFATQTNSVTGQKQHIRISPQQEAQIGQQQAPQMAQQFGGLDPDAASQKVVSDVGEGLQAHSDAAKSPYRIKYYLLADNKTINAFALPGGPVFITRALFDRLQSRGQLAGVLGHETGHVAARHSAQQMAKHGLTQGVAGAAVMGTSDGSNYTQHAAEASAIAGLLSLKYTRDDEKEADKLGVRFMSEAGYDPDAMVGVMEILEKASSGSPRGPDFLQTHPAPQNRIPLIKQEIAREFPQGVPAGLQR